MELLKEYLENGDFVKNRSGTLYLVYNSYLIRDNGYSLLNYYDSYLRHTRYSDMDIIAIYKPITKIDFSSFIDTFYKKLILSPEEIKQLINIAFYQYNPHFIDLMSDL